MPGQQRTVPSGTPLLKRIRRKLAWHIRQMVALPPYLVGYVLATPYYDYVLARRKRTFQGHIPPGPRVAVLLIFPRGGLKRSHLRTLSYFTGKGYAPLVVSNVPLGEADREAVLRRCWRLIERPNFGYDFGGYRDAILSLEPDRLERLVLMNDSCWFPLPGASDWLDDVEALGVDFAGAASNYGVPCPPKEDFRSISWTYRATSPGFHYCSFALCCSGALLRDRGFRRYWRRLRLTNDKLQVVRRGEVALTQWILKNGFSHGSTLDIARLDSDLEACSLDRIREIARELVIPEDARLRAVKRSVLDRFDGSQGWREDAIRFILAAVAVTGISYALPEFTLREKRFPFLKKSPLWLDDEGAESTLRIVAGLGGPDGAEIREEASGLRGVRAPSVAALPVGA